MNSAAPWPHGDPNAAVRAILAEPAFRGLHAAAGDAEPSALERFVRWLGDLAGPIFRRLFEGSGAAASPSVLMLVLYAVAALALLFVAAAVAELIAGSPALLRGIASAKKAPDALEAASAESLRREASAAAEAGDFGRAIALLFRAALLVLDRTALLTFDAARTPGEYRRLVRRTVAVAAPPFDELVTRFVHATFATRSAGRDDFEAAERAYATFVPRAVPA